MGLEQICVGIIISTLICAVSILFGVYFNFICDELGLDGFGYFMAMSIMSICFGICLTYILYMKGVI